jgi:TolB-like protein
MPFVNSKPDSTMEYLSDGFTENLINSLSKLPGVKLMSRNSVFRYKGKDIDPQEVGKKLGVGAILLGRISQNGNDISVSAELVNTLDDSHLWGEQYNSTPGRMMSLPGQIADAVSHQLDLTLTGAQERELSKQTTENSEAYQAYLKGIFHLRKRTTEGLLRAREYFDQAIAADAKFALAFAGLSDCSNLMGAYFVIPSSEARAQAKEAALKSIQLDDNIAEGHTALATTLENYDWNFSEAEEHYKRALSLNPNYATAHQWYGEFLAAMGRYEEAVEQGRSAQELDPLSPIIWVSSAGTYAFSGDLPKARRLVDKALELDSRFPRSLSAKALIGFLEHDLPGAIADIQRAIAYSDSSIEYIATLGFYYARAGRIEEGKRILNRLLHPKEGEGVFPYMIAIVYIGLGDRDRAFEWLEKEYQNHSFTLEYLYNDPFLLLLSDDPRYAALVRRVGLPPIAANRQSAR